MSLQNYKIRDVIIKTKDGESISVRYGLSSSFLIREDIFSPYMTAEIDIIDTDGLFYSKKVNSSGNETYISGGEEVIIQIENYTVDKEPTVLDTINMKNNFYVDTTTPIVTKSNKQLGTLRLVTREALANEISRVSRRYNGTIEETVKRILQTDPECLKSKKEFNKYLNPSDYKTINKYSFIGNIEKPFDVIRKLCAKSVPIIKKGENFKTAGYFFFENLDGVYFVGIDTLLEGKLNKPLERKYKGEKIAKGDGIPFYRYMEVIDKNVPPIMRIIDKPVIQSRNDVLSNLLSGMYGTRIIEYDAFNFKKTEFDLILNDIYKKSMNHSVLDAYTPPEPPLKNDIDFKDRNYSRRVYRIASNHAYAKGDNIENSFIDPNDTSRYQAESIIRTRLLFSQIISIQVPVNLDLRVGQIIYCQFPNAVSSGEKENRDIADTTRMTGRYLITALCHDFSYYSGYGRFPVTKLQLVKDSYADPKVK